ncbi:hypothetical protein MKX03_032999 [Papaver bracteatum]|nr:hypothetical protein MKX03_032999 [Papaver bracteatum]
MDSSQTPISYLQFSTISSSVLKHSTRIFRDQTNKLMVLKTPTSPRFRHVCNMSEDSDKGVKGLYLYHIFPVWYQFVTSTFCHANWNHLSSNLCLGANLVSWLVLPRNAVSLGASGAVFGLFAITVLVKMCWDWRKILEVLILGQFVIEKVMEAAQASTRMSGASSAMQSVNHIAHLSGALVGAGLVWLLSRVPSEPSDRDVSKLSDKTNQKT